MKSHLWYWMKPGMGGASDTVSPTLEPADGKSGLSTLLRLRLWEMVTSWLTPSGSPERNVPPSMPEML